MCGVRRGAWCVELACEPEVGVGASDGDLAIPFEQSLFFAEVHQDIWIKRKETRNEEYTISHLHGEAL